MKLLPAIILLSLPPVERRPFLLTVQRIQRFTFFFLFCSKLQNKTISKANSAESIGLRPVKESRR